MPAPESALFDDRESATVFRLVKGNRGLAIAQASRIGNHAEVIVLLASNARLLASFCEARHPREFFWRKRGPFRRNNPHPRGEGRKSAS